MAVRDLAIEILELDATHVTLDSSFKDDLSTDSLDMIEFAQALELLVPGLLVPEQALNSFGTIRDVTNYVVERMP